MEPESSNFETWRHLGYDVGLLRRCVQLLQTKPQAESKSWPVRYRSARYGIEEGSDVRTKR
jgi:hypothetical protein